MAGEAGQWSLALCRANPQALLIARMTQSWMRNHLPSGQQLRATKRWIWKTTTKATTYRRPHRCPTICSLCVFMLQFLDRLGQLSSIPSVRAPH